MNLFAVLLGILILGASVFLLYIRRNTHIVLQKIGDIVCLCIGLSLILIGILGGK